eukprot:6338852-Amphidinium_carterae.2
MRTDHNIEDRKDTMWLPAQKTEMQSDAARLNALCRSHRRNEADGRYNLTRHSSSGGYDDGCVKHLQAESDSVAASNGIALTGI